jgi:hypothetical protein
MILSYSESKLDLIDYNFILFTLLSLLVILLFMSISLLIAIFSLL